MMADAGYDVDPVTLRLAEAYLALSPTDGADSATGKGQAPQTHPQGEAEMTEEKVVAFPSSPMLGARAMMGTVESDLDPQNPSTDSLRGLLTKRAALIEQYTSGDGSVQEVEREICERLILLSGRP
jgi:hypothetical protein